MRVRWIIGMMSLAALVGAAPKVKINPNAIRVLIVTGNDYPGHKWRETAPAVRAGLEAAGDEFLVRVSEDPEIMATNLAARYDVVVLHYMNWETSSPSRAALEGLADFVRGGKGLVALHFACGAFEDWPEYVNLIGRVWDRSKTHDPFGTFRVQVIKKDHPITRDLDDFDIEDELYFCLKGEPKIEVLMTARSKKTGQDEPMAFVLPYGKGRVFQTVLGHDLRAMNNPAMIKMIQNACRWAAGR
ncbi:MAG: ThuA domain-containing protein [Candidatus Sumerlaeia bacterium]|nr:ThuA domain-containing protein [Candidatus Sumerlaeia bacterium]